MYCSNLLSAEDVEFQTLNSVEDVLHLILTKGDIYG
jgi:hypothetical protein